MAETRLTEHVWQGQDKAGLWHYWREDEQDRPAYESSIAIIRELAQALLTERERVAKLREALGIYADRNRWEATTDSYGDQIGTADMFVEDDHGLLKTDGWEPAQQALRGDGEGQDG